MRGSTLRSEEETETHTRDPCSLTPCHTVEEGGDDGKAVRSAAAK